MNCYDLVNYDECHKCREEKDQKMKCVVHYYFIILPQTFLLVTVLPTHPPMMNG